MKAVKLTISLMGLGFYVFAGILAVGTEENSEKIEGYLDDNLKEGKLKNSLKKAVDGCKSVNKKVFDSLNEEVGE